MTSPEAPDLTPLEALNLAVEILGGQTALAEVCGGNVKQQHVYNWMNRDEQLPDRHALRVQRATELKGRMVRASQLCPEAFPEDIIAA